MRKCAEREGEESLKRCQCGYKFDHKPDLDEQEYRSYAVIDDKAYQEFIELETKVLASKTEEEHFKAIGKSAQYVGSLIECPECTGVLLRPPELPDSTPDRVYKPL